jgi:hypothetical protein
MASKTKVTPQKEEMLEKEGAFVNLKPKSACDHYWDKTIEKTILRIFGSCTFSHKPRSIATE